MAKKKEPAAFTILAQTKDGEKIEVGPFRTRAAAEAEGKAYRTAGAKVQIAEGDIRNLVGKGSDDEDEEETEGWADDDFDDDDDKIKPEATHPFFRSLFGDDK